MQYLLALDEGTTSARAIVFNDEGAVVATAQREFTQHFPRPGWVEHDPEEIWSAQLGVARDALAEARLAARDVAAIGITNQRETTVVWDRGTGAPIHNAIVWQDRRTAPWCAQLRAAGHENLIRERTGLVIDAYFSAGKIAWLLDNVPGARARAEAGKLAFGTVDSWLVWKLTEGRRHVTDATNASRTMLFNVHTGAWDEELLKLLRVPASMLPEVRPSSETRPEAMTSMLGERAVPVAAIAGDQQAALFGQLCIEPGQTKTTYGTGCFLLQCTGTQAVPSRHGLLTTVACRLGNQLTYALEGSVFIGGAVVHWLRDGLGMLREAREASTLAATVPDSGGLVFVPAFTGLGVPHWDPHARGLLIGITRGTTRAHVARAALEGIACQVADVIDAMRADAGIPLREMRVDGGAAADDFLMQLQADVLGMPLVRPSVTETTALGAAYLAGLAVGVWKRPQDLAATQRIDRRFEPSKKPADVAPLRERWRKAVERARDWEAEQPA